MSILEKIRAAFDGDEVPPKNIQLRRAYDEIERLRAILKPFAALAETSNDNGYGSSPDEEIVRSAGTFGDDYTFITVADLRRARDALTDA